MGKIIKKGLGRGLDAIIPKTGLSSGRTIMNVPLAEIIPNRYQPRLEFDIKGLEDLASSIRTYGVTQPILVRKKDHGYELVAGERRLRASKLAGMDTIPVMVREINDKESLELALIENIQRADLSVLEEAEAYKRLRDEFGLTQEEVAYRVGRSRSVIANTLRLLELPQEIRDSIKRRELSRSHARTILGLESNEERMAMWQSIVSDKLNVRQVEIKVNEKSNNLKKSKNKKIDINKGGLDIFRKNLQEDISQILKTKVTISGSNTSGKIEINYFTFEDLERISDFIRSHPKAY